MAEMLSNRAAWQREILRQLAHLCQVRNNLDQRGGFALVAHAIFSRSLDAQEAGIPRDTITAILYRRTETKGEDS